jgi:hypothetical protein
VPPLSISWVDSFITKKDSIFKKRKGSTFCDDGFFYYFNSILQLPTSFSVRFCYGDYIPADIVTNKKHMEIDALV